MKKSSKIMLAAASAAVIAGVSSLYRVATARKTPYSILVKKALKNTIDEKSNYSDVKSAGRTWLENQPHETIHITSFDGLRLEGYLYERTDAKRTVLMMHGFRSSWTNDFDVVAKSIYDSGCNLLLAVQRAHGSSEGKHISYGIYERFDCIEWLNRISARFSSIPLYSYGISMGATTVLMASGLKLPGNMKGIIADCGFTSPKEIMSRVFKSTTSVPPELVVPSVNLYSRIISGYRFSDYTTLDAMKVNKTPVLFIHGDADNFVPLEMTMQNYEACTAPKSLFIVKGAGHAMSYLVDLEGYLEAVFNFFDDCEM